MHSSSPSPRPSDIAITHYKFKDYTIHITNIVAILFYKTIVNVSMVTSIFSSIFTSTNSALKQRIQAINNAEETLLELAHKMGASNDTIPIKNETDDDDTSSSSTAALVDINIFDTIINKSSIPCLNKKDVTCLLLGMNSCDNKSDSSINIYSKASKTKSKEKDDNDDELVIHGVYAESKSKASPNALPLVLLHGYMNGALYFYRNLKGLASQNSIFSGVYAIDMLGWGLSSRPKFTFENADSAEEFYVDSLEQWRKKNGIDKMILGGHSLGGYVAVAYCERYPQHVDKLLLLSPVGVAHKTAQEEEEDLQKIKQAPFSFRFLASTAMTFWANGITPGSFIRTFPESTGRKLVEGYVQKRLPAITDDVEQQALTDYVFHNSKLPGSGDYSLKVLLKPMAHAYKPLIRRIPKLKVSQIAILYGERDWMDPQAGIDVQKICNQDTSSSTPNVTVMTVSNCGHLLMLENWQEFNQAVVQAVNVMQQASSSANSSSIKVDNRIDDVHHSKKVVYGQSEITVDQSTPIPS